MARKAKLGHDRKMEKLIEIFEKYGIPGEGGKEDCKCPKCQGELKTVKYKWNPDIGEYVNSRGDILK